MDILPGVSDQPVRDKLRCQLLGLEREYLRIVAEPVVRRMEHPGAQQQAACQRCRYRAAGVERLGLADRPCLAEILARSGQRRKRTAARNQQRAGADIVESACRHERRELDGAVHRISRGKCDVERTIGVEGEPQPKHVHQPMVELAEAHHVAQVGLSAEVAVDDMMCVERDIVVTSRELARAVTHP